MLRRQKFWKDRSWTFYLQFHNPASMSHCTLESATEIVEVGQTFLAKFPDIVNKSMVVS